MAEQQNKAYVTDDKFRLMFLRAAGFHPQKAAIRLVAFFKEKLRYFGQEPLTRQIQLSDLDSDDLACLKAGHTQVLPPRDRSGRPIYIDLEVSHDRSFKTIANRQKACIFLWLMMAEDEENQKRGVVNVTITMGAVELTKIDPELVREFPRLENLAASTIVGHPSRYRPSPHRLSFADGGDGTPSRDAGPVQTPLWNIHGNQIFSDGLRHPGRCTPGQWKWDYQEDESK